MAIDKDCIVDLLNYLITDNGELGWKLGTGYHNGQDVSIYEVWIYEIKSNRTLARIAFNGFTGEVVNSTFLRDSAKSEQVIDLLLDFKNAMQSGETKMAS